MWRHDRGWVPPQITAPSGLLTYDKTTELDRATPHRQDGTEYLQPKDTA